MFSQNPEIIGRALKFFYYLTITSAFCANMLVVAQTTILSVLGAGLALRGPDGSMMTATDGLYEERTSVFGAFGVGLVCTLGSVVLCVWIILHWEAAVVCMFITLFTCRKVYANYRRICRRFGFDENETVDFRDIFDGPANIRYYARHNSKKRSSGNGNSQRNINYYHKHHSSPVPIDSRPSSPSEEDDEMNAFIPNNSNGRMGRVSQRKGGNICSNHYHNQRRHHHHPAVGSGSLGTHSQRSSYDYEGSEDGSSQAGEYEMRIQTV